MGSASNCSGGFDTKGAGAAGGHGGTHGGAYAGRSGGILAIGSGVSSRALALSFEDIQIDPPATAIKRPGSP
jgi:hypothetical protein